MKGYLSNENGEIIIENEVIAQYAGHAALECFGIVGMATIKMCIRDSSYAHVPSRSHHPIQQRENHRLKLRTP